MADKHVTRLVNLMVTARSRPFSVPPATMASLCKHLYALNPDYSAIQPSLFSSYLPNVGPRMTEDDLQVGSSKYSLELQTKVREDFTITEKAAIRAFFWLKVPSSTFTF